MSLPFIIAFPIQIGFVPESIGERMEKLSPSFCAVGLEGVFATEGRTRIVRRPTALGGSFDLIFRLDDVTLTGIPGNAKRQAVVPGCPRSHFALLLRNRRGRGTMQHIGRSRVSKRAQTELEMPSLTQIRRLNLLWALCAAFDPSLDQLSGCFLISRSGFTALAGVPSPCNKVVLRDVLLQQSKITATVEFGVL